MSKYFQTALAIALVMVLSACAVPAAPMAETEATAAPAEEAASEMDLSGQTLEVMAVWSENEQENFEAVLDAFSEQTGVEVTYTPVPGELATVLGTRLEGDQPPDVAMLPQPGLLVEFAQRGALVSLEDVAGDLVDENYADVWRELGTVEGTLYGVWYKAANKSLVWYNTNVFEDAGVEPADTWEDWIATAETLSAYGVPPVSIGAGSAWTLTDWFENVYIRSAGPEMYDQLTRHEIPWTDESVINALTLLTQMWQPDWIAGGVEGALEASHPVGIAKPFLDPPEAGFAYGADFSATAIANETPAEVGTDALFFPFPSIDGSAPSVVGGGDVAVLFNVTDAGRAFMRFLASAEAAEIWAERGGFTSPNQQVDPAVYPSDVLRQSAQALQAAEVFRFDMSDLQPPEFGGTAGQGLFGGMQEFLRSQDVEATAAQLEEEAAAAFAEQQ